LYQNYEKEIANRMFGYRVTFDPKAMKTSGHDPAKHEKPLTKFVDEVLEDLTASYFQMTDFQMKQRTSNKKSKYLSEIASDSSSETSLSKQELQKIKRAAKQPARMMPFIFHPKTQNDFNVKVNESLCRTTSPSLSAMVSFKKNE